MPDESPVLPTETLRRAPKVLLHDHLDGGLRPATVAELAEATGYAGLPTADPAELGNWFRRAADSGSLVSYLETFAHTCGVMQTEEALVRVAAEAVDKPVLQGFLALVVNREFARDAVELDRVLGVMGRRSAAHRCSPSRRFIDVKKR